MLDATSADMGNRNQLTSDAGVSNSANGQPAASPEAPFALRDGLGPAECGSHSPQWFVGKHKPFEGPRTVERLRTAGFPAHSPRILDRKPRRDDVLAPLFPGYVLVQFDLHAPGWGVIMEERIGLVGLLVAPVTGRPVPLPEGFVEALMASADQNDVVPDPRVKPAVQVIGRDFRVQVGPWAQFIGRCVSAQKGRVELLLGLFGRPIKVAFRREQLHAE